MSGRKVVGEAKVSPFVQDFKRCARHNSLTMNTRHAERNKIILPAVVNRPLAALLATCAALAATGCMSPPAQLDLALQHTTQQGRYVVTLEPPQRAPAINQLHAWKVKVESPAGQPVTTARIAVDGGMPQHGHGLPTQPLVRRQVADGTYLLEGMKFSMTGWWEVKLDVEAAQGPDKVTFNLVVNDPAATPQ